MGYYAYYDIDIYDHELTVMSLSHHNDIMEQLYVLYPESQFAIDVDGCALDMVKWYDCYDNFKEFSKRFPWLMFKVHETGEAGDEALVYVKNGKFQSCKIIKTYEEFDESKLK